MSESGHIFISYARRDGREHAEKLDSALQAVNFITWRDTRDIDPNQDFSAELERAIAASSYVVCCITPDTLRDESFVRREIGYALALKKPVVPLIFRNTLPPIQIINITRVDFTYQSWEQSIAELSIRLRRTDDRTYEQIALPDDPYRGYLHDLYAQIVNFLDLTVFSLIMLRGEAAPESVERRQVLPISFLEVAGIQNADVEVATSTPPIQFPNFHDAFDRYGRRILLLGEPGAGKTTTLFAFARDWVARRLADPALALPILLRIADWSFENPTSLPDWIANHITALNRDDVTRLLGRGDVLLLLDGLDELPEHGIRNPETQMEKEINETFNPRRMFLDAIPTNNSVAITCRIKDYYEIGQKMALKGAVILQPLDDTQMKAYLRDLPDLWNTLAGDDDLRQVARTPLLLSLFTFAFRDRPDALSTLHNFHEDELSDYIFEQYIQHRYEHEQRRLRAHGEQMPFTLKEIYNVLGYAAMQTRAVFPKPYQKSPIDFRIGDVSISLYTSSDGIEALMSLAVQLHLITQSEGWETYRFLHLLLRNHFGFGHSLSLVTEAVAYVPDPFKDDFDVFRHDFLRWRHRDAIRTLGNIGRTQAVEPLIDVLMNVTELREYAASALGDIGDNRAVEPLISVLGDSNHAVRREAAVALRNIADVRAVEPFIRALADTDYNVRNCAFDALGELGDKRAVQPLILALADVDAGVRRSAAAALGMLNDVQAIEPLVVALSDSNTDVRQTAVTALGRHGNTRVIKPLIHALTDMDYFVAHTAATALSRLGKSAFYPLVQVLLNHTPNPAPSRIQAAFALGELGDVRAIKPLISALGDRDYNVARSAAAALKKFADASTIERLIHVPRDGALNNYAVEVLVNIGEPAVEPLIRALGDADNYVRANAAATLGRLGDVRAVQPLIHALADTNFIFRNHAIVALGTLGDARAVEPLISALGDTDRYIRQSAAVALGRLGDVRAVQPLIHALTDADKYVYKCATDALKSIGTPEAFAAVQTWLERREKDGE